MLKINFKIAKTPHGITRIQIESKLFFIITFFYFSRDNNFFSIFHLLFS